MASLTIGAVSASAIDGPRECGPEFLQVTVHPADNASSTYCYANAGEASLYGWATRISTGNNRVQWYGDGRWQPEQPIGKWTVFTWPNHPGGVWISKIRIL
ncbi:MULTISPECIES: beta/gamma crystallin domain-containing protein [unclassified Streptomyces]|nr:MULTISPECIES: beta/gamma crystallin domain-containing protein [unclassified Streptomyces]